MATYGPVQLPAYFSNSSDFQTWVQGLHNALSGCGLVQTSDTGQINSTTVALPGTTSTSAGYEIWKTNDAAQTYAATQWYFKIEYGTGGTVDRPSVWLTVGTSTNGAGTLSGQMFPRTSVGPSGSKSAGAYLPVYASGDGSRFCLVCNADGSNNSFPVVLSAERTRSSSGAYTSDGILVMASGASPNSYWGAVPSSSAIAPTPTVVTNMLPIIPVYPNNGGSVHAAGGNYALGTVVYFIGAPFYSLNLTLIQKSDVSNVSAGTFTSTVLGSVHTFLTIIPPSGNGFDYYGATNVNNASAHFFGMLWE